MGGVGGGLKVLQKVNRARSRRFEGQHGVLWGPLEVFAQMGRGILRKDVKMHIGQFVKWKQRGSGGQGGVGKVWILVGWGGHG